MAVMPRMLPPQVLAARLLPALRALAVGETIEDRDKLNIERLRAELEATAVSVEGRHLSTTARFHRGVGPRRSPVEFADAVSRAIALTGLDRDAPPSSRLRDFVTLVEKLQTDPAAARTALRVLEVTNRLINGGEAPWHPSVEALTQFALRPDTVDSSDREEIESHLDECVSCSQDVETTAGRRAWLAHLPRAD